MPNINVVCEKCLVCAERATVQVPYDSWVEWQAGMHVQDAFPQLSPGIREVLISGTHPKCFDALMADEDEVG